jgi:pimeloyl-ACP methyl ester carboxylesterase
MAETDIHIGPGSFIEVKKILNLLTKGKNGHTFHIIAPSLPNFGFSEGPKKAGFGIPQYSEAMHKVMLKLGYDKYGDSRPIHSIHFNY